jgi:hypothetical protein
MEIIFKNSYLPRRKHNTSPLMLLKKLLNEELHKLYPSPSIIRMIKEDETSRACRTNEGETRNIYWKSRRKETTRKSKTYVDG